MRETKTTKSKTKDKTTRVSVLDIANKDPNYDYCFRRRQDVVDGVDKYGYEPVGEGNNSGEKWALPFKTSRNKSKNTFVHDDVILCRRSLEARDYFKEKENEKYNAHKNLIRTAASRAQVQLRKLDQNATVRDESHGINFTQRSGPNQEEEVHG